jgi:hypothetical protein
VWVGVVRGVRGVGRVSGGGGGGSSETVQSPRKRGRLHLWW